MGDAELQCTLQVTEDATGDASLAFLLRNVSPRPVQIRFFRPFLSFNLKVEADDGLVPVVQPAYNLPVKPERRTLAPGDTLAIDTPVRLRFDPRVPPSGGDMPTLWSLRHEPVPVRLRATLQLTGASVEECQAYFDPQAR